MFTVRVLRCSQFETVFRCSQFEVWMTHWKFQLHSLPSSRRRWRWEDLLLTFETPPKTDECKVLLIWGSAQFYFKVYYHQHACDNCFFFYKLCWIYATIVVLLSTFHMVALPPPHPFPVFTRFSASVSVLSTIFLLEQILFCMNPNIWTIYSVWDITTFFLTACLPWDFQTILEISWEFVPVSCMWCPGLSINM